MGLSHTAAYLDDLNCHRTSSGIPSLTIILTADASLCGIGWHNSYVFLGGSRKAVVFTSRDLATAEKNYSHIEEGPRAIFFAIKVPQTTNKHIYLRSAYSMTLCADSLLKGTL